ncbi:DUF262 domain-containing protein [Tenacibaculum sp. MAR_2010_89]|uniref:DUF262 domain-containing protein n=1 Tax=Tenacibaculum sp. MAR_2010_89 TaxID=1250198 RepID=UPI0015A19122|nr:DUF262 domain-containing protein [Tenacibaculum sp. MAR_2010_89]
MKTKYTFWELLSNYRIEIPKIQRDYAQGRKEPDIINIVDTFLEDIKKSIIEHKELNLDFVYGKVEDTVLIPLDGQQRLTTLFLIHWYIALKENKLTSEVKSILLKFSYETRVSSEDFCKYLVSENIDYSIINNNISDEITDSEWFFLSWEFDPTVSAMLNMLDLIHDKFKRVKEKIFDKLVEGINVTFQFLPLEQFKLTDELYIKMNARGKPLTEFENFKANFSQYLTRLEDKSKLDNEWLDVFWDFEKNNETEILTDNVDKQFFSFFKNITLNFYTEENYIDKDFIDNYNLFKNYNNVYDSEKYISEIISVFNGLITYNDTEDVFKNFLSSSVNYWERLRFYSLSKFFIQFGQVDKENVEYLNKWMRITGNLINNTLIQSPSNYVDAIRSVNDLSANISTIYEFVSNSNEKIKYFSRIQINEENQKAKLILNDLRWESILISIEKHSYFDGQVGFLLDFSRNNEGKHEKKYFKEYSLKSIKLFSEQFSEGYDFLFQRALLVKGDYLVDKNQNKTFCLFDKALRTKNDNWRKVFNDERKKLYLKELLDEIDDSNIELSLKKVIDNNTVKDWRKSIIEDPSNIAYCQYREIRQYSDNNVYLLSKRQMNGRHKEIYSWDLFKREFQHKNFFPFKNVWYWESTSWEEPCIIISEFNYNGGRFVFEIEFDDRNNKYRVSFKDRNEGAFPDIIIKILKKFGFKNDFLSLKEDKLSDKIKEISLELSNLNKD